MRFDETTPTCLAQTILANIGKEVEWRTIPIDGAQKAAGHIQDCLDGIAEASS